MPDISLESTFWAKGLRLVVGLDEVGRGPWAGPLVVGAVLIDSDCTLVEGVNDSKKLTAKKRAELSEKIKTNAKAWAIGSCDAAEIDRHGLARALQLAMEKAVTGIEQLVGGVVDQLICDGSGLRPVGSYPMVQIAKGDAKHYSVAAASIIAKVHRDALMVEYSRIYPGYGFESHVGYGTAAHTNALNTLGITPIHRKSFAPIAKFLKQ